jgi:hypothetical protein
MAVEFGTASNSNTITNAAHTAKAKAKIVEVSPSPLVQHITLTGVPSGKQQERGQDGEAKLGPDSQINRDRRARNLSKETVRCNPTGRRTQHDCHVRPIPNFKTEFETKANLTQANAIKTKSEHG